MKKTVIITLIVFVISALLTVCCAVALGATAFKEVFDNSGSFGEMLENFEEKFDGIEDSIENKFDPDLDDAENIVETLVLDGYELKKDTVRIGCDAAGIIILPSNDEKLSASMDIYSFNKKARDEFDIHTDYNGFDVYVTKADAVAKSSAEAIVYIPNTVKNIIVESKVAEVKVKNLTAESIEISVNIGDIEFENVAAEKCSLSVNTGEIELDDNVDISKTVKAVVNTGEISYELPYSRNAVINYRVDLGSVETDDRLSGYKKFDKDGNASTILSKSGRLESESGTDNAVQAELTVDMGSIEFKQIFG